MNRARSRDSGRYDESRGDTAGRNSNQQNEISLFQPALRNRIPQAQRNGPSGRISVAVNIDHHFRILKTQAVLHRANDA